MTETLKAPSADQLKPDSIEYKKGIALARKWGWTTPPEEIVRHAIMHLHMNNKSLPEIVDYLGYMPLKEAQDSLEQRAEMGRKDVFPIDWLGQVNNRVRDNKQLILCLQHGVQYLPSLNSDHYQVHEDLKTNPDIMNACERHEAVLIVVQESKNVLVFSDWDLSLRQYRQIAGIEAANDPLRLNYPDIHYAVAPKNQVLEGLNNARGQRGRNAKDERDESTSPQTLGIIYGERLKEDPTLRKLANIHDLALEMNASDIHINPEDGGIIIAHRVMGDMHRIPESLDLREYHEIKQFLLRRAGAILKFENIKDPKDGMYHYMGRSHQAYVRCSFIPFSHSSAGENAVSLCLRLIPVEHGKVDLADNGIQPDVISYIKNAITPDAGIVLLVGPTGSGKSTTVSGTVGLHQDIHGSTKTRFSIEDPVERTLPGIKQFQIPYHMRGKSAGFALILRNLLRHDPNMIWVGEIRDAETAEISVQAAATGHLLISTIHADNTTKAVERLGNMIPPDRQDLKNALIENLSLLVSQRLIKKLCTNCRIETKPQDDHLSFVEYINTQRGMDLKLPETIYVANPHGCTSPKCRNGFVGRIPVNEVLNVTNEVKAIYLGDNAKERFALIQQAVNIRLEDSIMSQIAAGNTVIESLQG